MTDDRDREYLQEVLALDPRSEAGTVLQKRREFLQPSDVVLARLSDGEHDAGDLRMRMLFRLANLRRKFWQLDGDDLERELSSLQNVAHAETVTAATRLQRVAAQRDDIRRLLADPAAHPALIQSLLEILIAPAVEANRLREYEHRCMRPEQNPQYESARRAVQGTAQVIRANYPEVYKLEEAWLIELIEYDPREETEDESANTVFGFVMLAGGGMTLFLLVAIVSWIFS